MKIQLSDSQNCVVLRTKTMKLRFSAYLADVCTPDYFTGISTFDSKEREVLAVPISPRMRYGELLKEAMNETDSLMDWIEDEMGEVNLALRECFAGVDLRTTFEPSIDLEDNEDSETIFAYFVITFEG